MNEVLKGTEAKGLRNSVFQVPFFPEFVIELDLCHHLWVTVVFVCFSLLSGRISPQLFHGRCLLPSAVISRYHHTCVDKVRLLS